LDFFQPRSLLCSLFLVFASFSIGGCESKEGSLTSKVRPVQEILLSATQSWSGEKFSYPDGESEMKLLRISIPKGFRTPVHTHPQPGVAYLVKGSLECVVKADQVLLVEAGDSFATTFGDVPHYCENISKGETILYVVYAGVKGTPITIPTKY
tara:strand:+ start:6523 stop:6981 length:459 start_codon:yes stop_codon:yes gene_type:complete